LQKILGWAYGGKTVKVALVSMMTILFMMFHWDHQVITFMVNYLADKKFDGGSFGGAMVVLPTCEVIAEMPIGREGVLYVGI